MIKYGSTRRKTEKNIRKGENKITHLDQGLTTTQYLVLRTWNFFEDKQLEIL